MRYDDSDWRYIGGKSFFIDLGFHLSFVRRYRIWDIWSLAWMRYPRDFEIEYLEIRNNLMIIILT